MANAPEHIPESDPLRQSLAELREALLHLHKSLIESERTGYEQTFGRIQSPYQFLKLLTEDPWFSWLRPVSQLLAIMDETLDSREPLTPAAVKSFFDRTRHLLVPANEGEGFSQHYNEALQRDPDVVLAHAAVARLLRSK